MIALRILMYSSPTAIARPLLHGKDHATSSSSYSAAAGNGCSSNFAADLEFQQKIKIMRGHDQHSAKMAWLGGRNPAN